MANAIAPVVDERSRPDGSAMWIHESWRATLPWLIHGTTARGADLGRFGAVSALDSDRRWRALRERVGLNAAVHARQVHGARVLWHHTMPDGVLIADDADGHATDVPGLLLTVSVADCVPIALVDPEHRAIALLHAGWRGVAAGMLEAGIRVLAEARGARADALRVHLGPAICGDCYEVGSEVSEALGLPAPAHPTPVDLRAVLVDRASVAGIEPGNLSVSSICTRCHPGFYSHRGGDRGRQVAFLGIHPSAKSTG